MSWRDEIDIALQDWIAALGGGRGGQRWHRVGPAHPTGEPGVYVVDIRASDLTADQADNLRLAGPDERNVQAGFSVMDATIDGELIRVRVAEFAAPAEPYLWRQRQQPTFLITALRDGLSALSDAGLAGRLARGEVGACWRPSPHRLGCCPRRRIPTGPAWAGGCGWCGARRARGKPGCFGLPPAT